MKLCRPPLGQLRSEFLFYKEERDTEQRWPPWENLHLDDDGVRLVLKPNINIRMQVITIMQTVKHGGGGVMVRGRLRLV